MQHAKNLGGKASSFFGKMKGKMPNIKKPKVKVPEIPNVKVPEIPKVPEMPDMPEMPEMP